MTFNLVDEPWIPTLLRTGEPTVVSLRECFGKASLIQRISAELPTQSFAIVRLLLAICHDAIGFHRDSEMERLHETGLDVDRIARYLDEYHDRFDLFDRVRPFFQVAGLRTAKNEASGLEKLISDVPNGAQFMTTRMGRGLQQVSAAEAAIWVVHCQMFDPSGIRSGALGDSLVKGGKGYPIGPGWAGQIGGVVLHGSHLLETLALNIVPTKPNLADRPVWAKAEPQTATRAEHAWPSGPVELLVWQSRRIRLVGDANGVTAVVLSQGDKMTPQNRENIEFMTPWRYSQPQTKKAGRPTYMPLKHDPQRAAWRGAPGLLSPSPTHVDGSLATLPPKTITNVREFLGDSQRDLTVGIELVGMTYGAQEAVVEDIVSDTLDFRVSMLGPDAAPVTTMAHDAIARTDSVVYNFGRLAANLASAAGDFDGVAGHAERAKLVLWAALDAPARAWLASLTASSDTIEAHRQWQITARDVTRREANRLVESSSPAAIVGRATKFGYLTAALAETYFNKALREHLPLAFPKDNSKENPS